MKMDKMNKLIMETYTELYANCTTPVDFGLLVAAAECDENGRKMIPFDKYFIDGKLFDKIVEEKMKKAKLKKEERKLFKISVYLGCSPTTILDNNE